jgi:hypothetical protein
MLQQIMLKIIIKTSKAMKLSKQLLNRLLALEGRLFLSEIREKRPEFDNFWAIPAAFNHCYIQKIIALL